MARLVETCAAKEAPKNKKRKHEDEFMSGFWKRYIERTLREFTMTDFEKEKFLFYFKSALNNKRIEVWDTTGAILCKTLEKFYKVDISEFFKDDNYAVGEDSVNYEIQEKLEGIVAEIKQKPSNDILKNKFEWIAEIFELSNLEKELIIYLYITKTNKCLEYLVDRGCTTSGRINNFYYLFESDLRRSNISTMLKRLSAMGFYDDNGEMLTQYYTNLVENEQLNTKTKFIKYLTGTPIKAELTLKDFEHIKQISLIRNILKNAAEKKKKGVNILLAGFSGTGKTTLASALAKDCGITQYAVATDSNEREISRIDRLSDLNTKQAILKRIPNTCLLFDEAEDIFNHGFNENGTSSKGYLNRLLENNAVPCIYTSNAIANVDVAFMRRMNYILEMPQLTTEQRTKLWNRILKKNKLKLSKKKIEELSECYDVPPSIIANAVETTKLIDGNDDTFGEVIESVAKIVTKKTEVKKQKDFDESQYCIDIVNTDTDIKELTDKLIKSNRVDFSMCLSGASGCGKSYWAKKLLTDMGIEYIMFRPSDILSKWVGEDEENLKNYFTMANQKKCALIIDEADTFVAEREIASHSWERSLTNEFLVQTENFKYPLICTTNLMNIVDSAAYRRFLIKVKFDYMKPIHFKKAMQFFFNIETDRFLKGVTPADFSVVKKEIEFFGNSSEDEIFKLLKREVDVKKDKEIKDSIGF